MAGKNSSRPLCQGCCTLRQTKPFC
jgi:hypothetical protein